MVGHFLAPHRFTGLRETLGGDGVSTDRFAGEPGKVSKGEGNEKNIIGNRSYGVHGRRLTDGAGLEVGS